jgi:hypothetical protein
LVAEQVREWFAAGLVERAQDAAGGPARLRVVVLLTGVLALSTADAATVGAVAGQLEHGLGPSNTMVGPLVTGSVGVGPLLFAYPSTVFGGSGDGLGQPSDATGGRGLEQTFLLALAALVVAGLLLLVRARASYPRDVATAIASERAAAGRRPARPR